MKKYGVSFVLLLLLILMFYPISTAAKVTDGVEVDICIIGGDNHFVYKIPKNLHKDTAYNEMKNYIETSLSSHWKVQKAHYEMNQSNVAYTFYIEDLFQMKQDGQLKLSIPYKILVGMFGENDQIQLRIIASKLTDWTVNAKEWAALGFVPSFTFLSEIEYVFDGAVNELLLQRVGHFDGAIDKGQMVLYSIFYFGFIFVQMVACLLLARSLKKRILRHPEDMHQYRKLLYTYQLIPLAIIFAQIVFLVMSGLLTAFGLYFTPGIDLLLIVGPILLNLIVMPMFFVTTESEISKELRNKTLGTDM